MTESETTPGIVTSGLPSGDAGAGSVAAILND
jgi:hypothetical protein